MTFNIRDKYLAAAGFITVLLLCFSITVNIAQYLTNQDLKGQIITLTEEAATLDETRNTKEVLVSETADKIGANKKNKSPRVIQEQWARTFIEAAEFHKIPLKLALQVSQVESGITQITSHGYNMCSRIGETLKSCAGAAGVMQVMPFWASTKADSCPYAKRPEDLKSATVNIWCGVYVLAHYRDRYNTWEHALTAYNGGPRAVQASLRGRDYTDNYAGKVLTQRI